MAQVLVSLNDLEDHSPVAGLFVCNTSNICAAIYQIATVSVLVRSPSDSWASCVCNSRNGLFVCIFPVILSIVLHK